jgi:hypothetical protein
MERKMAITLSQVIDRLVTAPSYYTFPLCKSRYLSSAASSIHLAAKDSDGRASSGCWIVNRYVWPVLESVASGMNLVTDRLEAGSHSPSKFTRRFNIMIDTLINVRRPPNNNSDVSGKD